MNKTLYIIVGILLVILLIFIIYKCAFSKQNFQITKLNNFKLKSKIKDNFKQIVEKERIRLQKEIQKKYKNLKNKNRALRNLESSDVVNTIPEEFKNSVPQYPLGNAIFLNDCVFLEPSNVRTKATYYIFKEKLPVGEDNLETGLKKIVNSKSYQNTEIQFFNIGKEIKSELTKFKTTSEIIDKLSTEISGNVGGSYSKLSVNASFNYLTTSETNTTENYQALP
jgi:hypothetical protein